MKGIIDILKERVTESPDRVIYNFLDYSTEQPIAHEITTKMLFDNAKALAGELLAKGAKKGDRVVILSLQDPGTLYAVYGAMMAGTLFTIIPPPIDEGKVQRFISVVKSCKPKFLISNYALEHAQHSEIDVKKRLAREALLPALGLKRIYTDRLPIRSDDFPIHAADPGEVVYLQYTSGSTSDPKGVMVTMKNLMTNIAQVMDVYDFSTGNNLGMWIPFFHNLGLLIGIYLPVMALEGTAYFLPTLQFLQKPTLWLSMLSRYKINITAGPNSAYAVFQHILTSRSAAEFDLSHVNLFINGSEFVDPLTIKNFAELFAVRPDAFAPGYGLAENVCLATVAHRDYRTVRIHADALRKNRFVPCEHGEGKNRFVPCEHGEGKEIVSLGKPVKGLTMVAVDPESGKPCDDGRIGEIYIQGDSVCQGYWGNVKDNENFRARVEGLGGEFYKTGDLGIIYRGDFYMTGRIKELIVVNGHNVYPGDIRSVLQKNIPAVPMGSAVFFPVEANKQEAVAICLEADNVNLEFASIASRINHVMADHFEFSFYDVVFVKKDSLPRTDNRKIRTHKVREHYLQGSLEMLFSSRNNASARQKTTVPETSPDGIHAKVREVFDTLLETQNYDLNTGFMELGGDSLKLVECVYHLEEAFNIGLDITEMGTNASVNGIAAYIQNKMLQGSAISKKINLQEECYLDLPVVPAARPVATGAYAGSCFSGESAPVAGPAATVSGAYANNRASGESAPVAGTAATGAHEDAGYTHSVSECRRLFLTGSTGFLGAFLIRSLLEQFAGLAGQDITIYCHVRARDEAAGLERVISNMKRYRCWKEEYAKRIQAVTGSLEKPLMGMKEDVYERLSREVDAIYHNGALLNFLYPYSYLKGTNVDGTRECLRFAFHGKAKYFHYISSYSVYDNPSHFGKKVYESDPLSSWEGYFLGYSETKWVSEKLVQMARERGLRACIYRPGEIAGDTVHGIWETKDLLSRLITGCILMQKAPAINTRFQMVPVDYVADTIAHISRQEGACGLAFNILNPGKLTVKKMVRAIRSNGYKIGIVPYERWKQELLQTDIRENPLRILASLFNKDTGKRAPRQAGKQDSRQAGDDHSLVMRYGSLQPHYDMTNTFSFLKHSGIKCPPVNRKLLHLYMEQF
jgi:thioester reductase-like protein